MADARVTRCRSCRTTTRVAGAQRTKRRPISRGAGCGEGRPGAGAVPDQLERIIGALGLEVERRRIQARQLLHHDLPRSAARPRGTATVPHRPRALLTAVAMGKSRCMASASPRFSGLSTSGAPRGRPCRRERDRHPLADVAIQLSEGRDGHRRRPRAAGDPPQGGCALRHEAKDRQGRGESRPGGRRRSGDTSRRVRGIPTA